MWKGITIVIILLCSVSTAFPSELPKTLEEFAAGFSPMKCKFLGFTGMSEAVLYQVGDERFEAITIGDMSVLREWERDSVDREFIMSYSAGDGVVVLDVATNRSFVLLGHFTNHPIDVVARSWNSEQFYKFEDELMGFEIEAWNAEAERLFIAISGKNSSIVEFWNSYMEEYGKMIFSLVKDRDGSKWPRLYKMGMLDFVKGTVKILQSYVFLACGLYD